MDNNQEHLQTLPNLIGVPGTDRKPRRCGWFSEHTTYSLLIKKGY